LGLFPLLVLCPRHGSRGSGIGRVDGRGWKTVCGGARGDRDRTIPRNVSGDALIDGFLGEVLFEVVLESSERELFPVFLLGVDCPHHVEEGCVPVSLSTNLRVEISKDNWSAIVLDLQASPGRLIAP